MRYSDVRGRPYSVGWTQRGLTVDGRAQLLLSGDVHYSRAFPAEQDQALDKLREDSLNAVQTYAFWSLHEPEPGALCWGEADAASSAGCSAAGARANITRFLQAAAARDLWVILRIGPFICGEWTYGGIPSWINGKPGVQIRSHNPSWETAMTAFVRAIWRVVEPFTAVHGGPVVMLQLENENGRAVPGDPYTEYIASLARSLDSPLPFLWCEGGLSEIVPFNAINTTGKPSPFVPAINGNDGSACKLSLRLSLSLSLSLAPSLYPSLFLSRARAYSETKCCRVCYRRRSPEQSVATVSFVLDRERGLVSSMGIGYEQTIDLTEQWTLATHAYIQFPYRFIPLLCLKLQNH